MKNKKNVLSVVAAVAFVSISIFVIRAAAYPLAFGHGVKSSVAVNGSGQIPGTEKTGLSENEIAGLVQMREEEKLARDVYMTLGDTWNKRIFSNISSSEQTHMDAVKVLLARYSIPDPVVNDAVGEFTSPSMRKLYDELVLRGKASLTEALTVGATVEDLDIRDLDVLKAETSKADILATYDNLQNGSRNHLRAFVKNIQAERGSYVPQYISKSEYDSIISE